MYSRQQATCLGLVCIQPVVTSVSQICCMGFCPLPNCSAEAGKQ